MVARPAAYSVQLLPIRLLPSLSPLATRHLRGLHPASPTGTSLATIPFLFIHFRTLFALSKFTTAFLSIVFALFCKTRGVGVSQVLTKPCSASVSVSFAGSLFSTASNNQI